MKWYRATAKDRNDTIDLFVHGRDHEVGVHVWVQSLGTYVFANTNRRRAADMIKSIRENKLTISKTVVEE